MKLGAGSLQNVPLLARLRVKWITREGERDPRPAVDEDGFAMPH